MYPAKLSYTYIKILILFFLISFNNISAQKSSKLSYYQEQQLSKADEYFEQGEYINAINLYLKIHKKVSQDTLVMFRLAESYQELNSYEKAERWYSAIITKGSGLSKSYGEHILNYAQVLTINGKYNDALFWYKEYYTINSSDPRGKAGILTLENLSKLYHDTIFYVVYPSPVSTAYSEYCPTPYQDGIVFCSNRPRANISESNKGNKVSYLNWYYSETDEYGKLTSPSSFNKRKAIKTLYNEGPAVFFNNGNALVFTQNAVEEKEANVDVVVHPLQLYIVEKDINDKWGKPYRLPFCQIDYSYAQPAISSDGNTLIFSSNMPGGFGEADLYLSRRIGGEWGQPVNLGKRFNSIGNEMFPFLLNDSLLYFSSDGHGGLGGLDICYAPLDEEIELSKFGFPMNSSGDDFGIMYDQDIMSGYLSSNRESDNNVDNIFTFRIVRISFTIKIIDVNTSNPIQDAEIFSISGLDEEFVGKTDKDGFCKAILPVSKEIKIRIKKENFKSLVYTYEPVKYKTENIVVLPMDLKPDTVDMVADKKPVTYRVQVMASRRKAAKKDIRKKYKGDLPVKEIYENNWYKYIIGEFDSFPEACKCLQQADVYDAFIAAYIDGERVAFVTAKSEDDGISPCKTEYNKDDFEE